MQTTKDAAAISAPTGITAHIRVVVDETCRIGHRSSRTWRYGEREEHGVAAATEPGSGKHPWRARRRQQNVTLLVTCRVRRQNVKGNSGKGKAGQRACY